MPLRALIAGGAPRPRSAGYALIMTGNKEHTMADKTHSDPYNPYAPEPALQQSTWTDGLPHAFTGWGPQTPDPDAKPEPAPAIDLVWKGGGDHRDHQVWSFDRRRHH
jgi:hypothetical protein